MWCKCTSLIILSCAEPHPRLSRESVAQLLRVHYNFRQAADRGGAYRTSSLSLRRVRCRRRHCGPALVKTRSRELVSVNREAALRHSRAGGDDNTLRRVRPHGGGGCGNSEQSDSHEPGNRSMLRHQNLLRSPTPTWCLSRKLRERFNSDSTSMNCANAQIGQRSCPTRSAHPVFSAPSSRQERQVAANPRAQRAARS